MIEAKRNRIAVECISEKEVPEIIIRAKMAELISRKLNFDMDFISRELVLCSEPYEFDLVRYTGLFRFAKGGQTNEQIH